MKYAFRRMSLILYLSLCAACAEGSQLPSGPSTCEGLSLLLSDHPEEDAERNFSDGKIVIYLMNSDSFLVPIVGPGFEKEIEEISNSIYKVEFKVLPDNLDESEKCELYVRNYMKYSEKYNTKTLKILKNNQN